MIQMAVTVSPYNVLAHFQHFDPFPRETRHTVACTFPGCVHPFPRGHSLYGSLTQLTSKSSSATSIWPGLRDEYLVHNGSSSGERHYSTICACRRNVLDDEFHGRVADPSNCRMNRLGRCEGCSSSWSSGTPCFHF